MNSPGQLEEWEASCGYREGKRICHFAMQSERLQRIWQKRTRLREKKATCLGLNRFLADNVWHRFDLIPRLANDFLPRRHEDAGAGRPGYLYHAECHTSRRSLLHLCSMWRSTLQRRVLLPVIAMPNQPRREPRTCNSGLKDRVDPREEITFS